MLVEHVVTDFQVFLAIIVDHFENFLSRTHFFLAILNELLLLLSPLFGIKSCYLGTLFLLSILLQLGVVPDIVNVLFIFLQFGIFILIIMCIIIFNILNLKKLLFIDFLVHFLLSEFFLIVIHFVWISLFGCRLIQIVPFIWAMH